MAGSFNMPNVGKTNTGSNASNGQGVPAGGAFSFVKDIMPVAASNTMSAIGIGTSMWQNNQNLKRAQKNALQERQWQLEDRDHYEMYNSAAMQLARLRAAGYNPLLANGSPAVSAGDTQALTASRAENPQLFDVGSQIAGAGDSAFNAVMQTKNIKLQEDMIKLNKDRLSMDKDRLEMDKLNSEVDRQLKNSQKEYTYAQKDAIEQSAKLTKKQVDTFDERFEKEMANMDADTKFKVAQTKTEDLLRNLKKKQMEAEIKNIYANTALTYAQKEQAVANTKLAYQSLEANLPKLNAMLLSHQITSAEYAARLAKETFDDVLAAQKAEAKTRKHTAGEAEANAQTFDNMDDNSFHLLRTFTVFLDSTIGAILGGLLKSIK